MRNCKGQLRKRLVGPAGMILKTNNKQKTPTKQKAPTDTPPKQTNKNPLKNKTGEEKEENVICLSQLNLKLILNVCLLRVRKFL